MNPDVTDGNLTFALELVRRVINRLGPEAPPLSIVRLGYNHGFDERRFDWVLSAEPAETILIDVRTDDQSASFMGANFTVVTPHEDAVAAAASHIQEHVLEYTCGDALPPCPGHRHPLQTGVVDGVASWVCPKDRAHYVEPIMPADV